MQTMTAKELKALLKNDASKIIVDDKGSSLTLSVVRETGDFYRLVPGLVYVEDT